jgi:hypothetical protein
MSKSNVTELDLLKYTFNGTAIPWAAAANLYVAAHTGDPGEAGDQTTNEAAYTGYARVLVSRDAGGWNTAANPVVNVAEITFPQCTGGSETLTHISVGLAASGASQILYSGILAAPLAVSNLITPRVIAGALQISED